MCEKLRDCGQGLNHYLVDDILVLAHDGSLHSAAKRRSQRDYYRLHHSISNLVIGSQKLAQVAAQTKQRLVVVKRALLVVL